MKNFVLFMGLLSISSTAFADMPEQPQESPKSLSCRLTVHSSPSYAEFKAAKASSECPNGCSSYIDMATIRFNDLSVAGYSCSALYSPQNEGTFGRINIKIKNPSGGISGSFVNIGTKDKVEGPNMILDIEDSKVSCSCELK